MKQVTLQDLLEAGCHFGHQTKRWNPKMKEFVYGSKSGISIIDLTKTIRQIADACNFLQRAVSNGSRILFVGTKRQAQQIVRETADATGMYHVSERWLGGTLTNNVTIKKSIARMREIDALAGNEAAAAKIKKKELSGLMRQAGKLHRDLDGIADMRRLPDVVVIVDVCHDEIAVKEARKLGIPIVAIVDTNGNPENIDYPIAANDDAVKSIKIIVDTFSEAIRDAAELYQKKVVEDKGKEDSDNVEKMKGDDKPARQDRGGRGDRSMNGAKRPQRKRPSAPRAAAPASSPKAAAPAAAGESKDEAKKDAKPAAPKKKSEPKAKKEAKPEGEAPAEAAKTE